MQYEPCFPYPTPEERTLWWLLFGFDGRIPRSTYWYVVLVKGLVVNVVFMLLVFGVMGLAAISVDAFIVGLSLGSVFFAAVSIPLIWSGIAVQVKRWHDLNKPGTWALIGFVPYIGPVWVLIECGCMRGTFGKNWYGPDPTPK